MNKFQKSSISILLILSFIFSNLMPLWADNAKKINTKESPAQADNVKKIGPKEFDEFLKNCNMEDRLQLGLALELISQKEFENKENWKDIETKCSLEEIKVRLNNNSYHTFNLAHYKDVEYHEIVEWVANSMGIETSNKGTQTLEEEIIKKAMEKVWDSMTKDQRKQLLQNIQNSTNTKIDDIDKIIVQTGRNAIAILIGLKAVFGFKFISLAMVFFHGLGVIMGITFSFGFYTGLSKVLATLTGPWGWGILIITTILSLGQPNPNDVIKFVITTYFIRMRHNGEK